MSNNYYRLKDRVIRQWQGYIAERGIAQAEVTYQTCRDYMDSRLKVVSGSSAATERAILSALYNELLMHDKIEFNPWSRVRLNRKESLPERTARALEQEQAKAFIKAAKKHKHGLALLIALGCGLRISEVCGIYGHQVVSDGEYPFIALADTKTEKRVDIALPLWVAEQIRASGWLDGRLITEAQFRKAFKEVIEIIGLSPKDYTPHSLRATAISNLLDKGVSHRDVCRFSRHSGVRMVERYDTRRATVKNSVANLNEYK